MNRRRRQETPRASFSWDASDAEETSMDAVPVKVKASKACDCMDELLGRSGTMIGN